MEKISHEAGGTGNFNSRRCFHGIQQLIRTGVGEPVEDGWMDMWVFQWVAAGWMGCRGVGQILARVGR